LFHFDFFFSSVNAAGMPLPAIYTTAFDLAQPSGGKVTVLALNKILAVSGLSPATVDKV
jgi:sorting nexin-8